MMAVAVLLAVTSAAAISAPTPAPTSSLMTCRARNQDFDAKRMPEPCQAAANDAALPIAERVEALCLLAQAHILNGDNALAGQAFMRMLLLAPSAALPSEAGPRIREVFVAVKQSYDQDSLLLVEFVPPLPPEAGTAAQLQIDVVDKLGRVVGARVRTQSSAHSEPLEAALVRRQLAPGKLRFTGPVPEPSGSLPIGGATLHYQVVLDTLDTRAVSLATPLTGTFARQGVAALASDDPPWTLIGLSMGGGVLVASALVAGLVHCFTIGACRSQEAWVRVRVQP